VQTATTIDPPRIVIHGADGAGKTTFAASMLRPVVLPCEDGRGVLKVPMLPVPHEYGEVMEAIDELLKVDHEYRSFVVDTVDRLEPLIWDQTCRAHTTGKNKYEHIEDFGYAKGYLYADPYWQEFFQGLDALRREKSMTICVLCHSAVVEIKDPNLGPYHKIEPRIHKRGNELLRQWADIVGYLEIERVAVDQGDQSAGKGKTIRTAAVTGRRVLYLEDQGSFKAKNRYGLPPEIEIPLDQPFEALRSEVMKRIQPASKEAK
jgi:hypothetical protein